MALSCRDLAKVPSLDFWLQWCDLPPLYFPLHKPPAASMVLAAADARSDGDLIGIGGFIQWEEGPCTLFSQTWTLDDLAILGLPLQHPAHRDITCYEALAQLGLMLCLRSVVPSARWVVRMRTLSDNTGAEAGINKLYSSHFQLSAFLKRLCMLACLTGIELDVGHVPGEKNDDADWLSRWNDQPCHFPASFRRTFAWIVGLIAFGSSGLTSASFHRILSLSGSLLRHASASAQSCPGLLPTLPCPALDFCQLSPAPQSLPLDLA